MQDTGHWNAGSVDHHQTGPLDDPTVARRLPTAADLGALHQLPFYSSAAPSQDTAAALVVDLFGAAPPITATVTHQTVWVPADI